MRFGICRYGRSGRGRIISAGDRAARGSGIPEVVFDFLGEWEGTYGCKALGVDPLEDILRIEQGEQEGEYIVTLHVNFDNPSVVVGTARGSDAIVIAEQRMGGMLGTAEIIAEGEGLRLLPGGFGSVCEGTYRRAVR